LKDKNAHSQMNSNLQIISPLRSQSLNHVDHYIKYVHTYSKSFRHYVKQLVGFFNHIVLKIPNKVSLDQCMKQQFLSITYPALSLITYIMELFVTIFIFFLDYFRGNYNVLFNFIFPKWKIFTFWLNETCFFLFTN